MSKAGYIYIMTNKNRTTLYIGVTNDLCRRIYEHKNHLIKNSFTDKYNIEYCIYYEEFPLFDLAIKREKELKKWNRKKKEILIIKKNPEWKELVTESGFVRERVSFSQQVDDFLKEFQVDDKFPRFAGNASRLVNDEVPPFGWNDSRMVNDEVPPSGRNDNAPETGMGEGVSGFAANPFSSPQNEAVIPNETKWSEESSKMEGGGL